jgi:hypothetical protein
VDGWVEEGGSNSRVHFETVKVAKFKVVMKATFVKLTTEMSVTETKCNAIFDVCITTYCTLLSNFRRC